MTTGTEQNNQQLAKTGEKKILTISAEDMFNPIGGEQNVMALFNQYRKAFEVAAPKHCDVNRMMRIAMVNVTRNPQLLDCTMGSLVGVMMACTQLGLELGGPLQQAHPVPFRNKHTGKKEVQLIIDYRGYMKLARNSGEISSFTANVVYKQDHFEYSDGLTQRLDHVPNDEHDEKDEDIIAAYAIARFKDGGFQCVVLRRKRLDKIRAQSKMPQGDAWKDHLPEMFKKSCIRRLAKHLPLSPELALAHHLDERADLGAPQRIELVETGIGALGAGSSLEVMTSDAPSDDKVTGVEVISPTELKKFEAFVKRHKWSAEQINFMLKKAVSVETADAIPATEFERVIALLEEGPKTFMAAHAEPKQEKQQKTASSNTDVADEQITKDEFEDLYAFVTETRTRKDAVMQLIKDLGYTKVSEIKRKHLKQVWDVAKAKD